MFSAVMMLGLATATMVESTRIMKKPSSMAHNAFQGSACGVVMDTDAATEPQADEGRGRA